MAGKDSAQAWGEACTMEMCKSFLDQLPETHRNQLLASYLPKPNNTDPATILPGKTTTNTLPEKSKTPGTPAPLKENARTSRGQMRTSPRGRLNERTAQSGSRKRRQKNHADQDFAENTPIDAMQPQREYDTVPVFLQNSIPVELKGNPKKLHELLRSLKPEAKIKSITVCKSGDIRLIAQSPHDENILRQPWAPHEAHGQLKPRLPKEKTANHEVTIVNIPTCISNQEIKDRLNENQLSPKDIYRFNKKGSTEPSKNVKVTFGLKSEKDHLISHGFGIYSQHFKVFENKPLPSVLQCYKCQGFGHNFFDCAKSESVCLRCGGNHRLSSCTTKKEEAKCANCAGNHPASYRGCTKYKEALMSAKDKEKDESKKVPASYAAKTKQVDPEALLACLAECLSELVSLVKTSMEKGEPLDDMKPFSIVSTAAARHMNIQIDVNDLFVKGLCPSPPKGGQSEKRGASQSTNVKQPSSTST